MATYTIQTDPNGPDWPEDPAMRFKHLRFSRDGHPLAQTVFDDLRRRGQYARLVRWMDEEPTVVAVTR